MATVSSLSFNVYNGTGGSTSWGSPNEYKRFYAGKVTYDNGNSNWYRSRVVCKTTGLIISSASKLVIRATVAEGNYYINKLRARLTRENIVPNTYYESSGNVVEDAVKNKTLAISQPYSDQDGKNAITGGAQDKGTVFYFVFDVSQLAEGIKPDETLYIFIGQEGGPSFYSCATVGWVKLTHETYTKCGAPTNITLEGEMGQYITPTGSFRIKWQAGTDGNANPIEHYRVHYVVAATAQTPTAESPYIRADKSELSTTITLSKLLSDPPTRGYIVKCAVVAVGEVDGYDSSVALCEDIIKINRIPGKPALEGTEGIVASDFKDIYIKATAGTDKDTDQTYSVECEIEMEGELLEYKEKIAPSLAEGDSITYRFMTFDGLEYSDPVERTITRNIKPKVSLQSASKHPVQSSPGSINHNLETEAPYVFNIEMKAQNVENTGQSTNNTYNYKIALIDVKDDEGQVVEIELGSNEKNVLELSDIREKLWGNAYFQSYIKNQNCKYTVLAQRNDGIELSNWVESVTTDENGVKTIDFYTITKLPSIQKILNTNKLDYHANSFEPENYFSNSMRIYTDWDDGYGQMKLRFTYLDNDIEKYLDITPLISQKSDLDNVNCRLNEYVFGENEPEEKPSNPIRGKTHQISIIPYDHKDNEITGYAHSNAADGVLTTLTRALSFELNNPEWGGLVNPFLQDSGEIAFTNYFQTILTEDNKERLYNEYGFSSAPKYTITAAFNNKTHAITGIEANYSKSNSTAYILLDGDDIYELFSDLGLNQINDIDQETKLTISVANAFKEIVSSDSFLKNVNYYDNNDSEDALKITASTFSFDSIEDKPIIIKENMQPILTLTCESYYGAPVRLEVKGINGDKTFYSQVITPEWNQVINQEQGETGELGNGKPQTFALSNISLLSPIGEQTEDLSSSTKFEYTIVLQNNLSVLKSENYGLNTAQVYKHVPGAIILKSAEYSETGQTGFLNLKCQVSDFGITKTNEKWNKGYTVQLSYKTPGSNEWLKNVWFDFDSETKASKPVEYVNISNFDTNEIEVKFDTTIFKDLEHNTEYDYLNVRLELSVTTSYQNGVAETTKTVYTSEYTIYNVQPTVSYRKNKLGINYNFPVDGTNYTDALLVIGEHSGANRLYMVHQDTPRIVDVQTGKIINFIVDCGTWTSNMIDPLPNYIPAEQGEF